MTRCSCRGGCGCGWAPMGCCCSSQWRRAPIDRGPEEPQLGGRLGGLPRAMAANKGALGEAQISIAADHPIRAAIADVRENDSATNWCLAKLTDDMLALEVVGSGTGGVAELKAVLSGMEAALAWAVCNIVAIDGGGKRTPKCVFLQWVPFAAPAIRKARMGTHKSAVVKSVGRADIELVIDQLSEVRRGLERARACSPLPLIDLASGTGHEAAESLLLVVLPLALVAVAVCVRRAAAPLALPELPLALILIAARVSCIANPVASIGDPARERGARRRHQTQGNVQEP